MPQLAQNGAHPGTSFARHPPSPASSASSASSASLEAEQVAHSSPSSGPASPSGSPRTVTVHLGARRAIRPAHAGAPQPGLGHRSARPEATLSLAEALSQAGRAQLALDHLVKRDPGNRETLQWASQVRRDLRNFLQGVHLAEKTAMLGGIESLEARSARQADLQTLALSLEKVHRRLQAALAQMPALRGPAAAATSTAAAAASAATAPGDPLQALRGGALASALASVRAHTLGQLSLRQHFLASSEQHHPFYLPRMLQSKALYWEAASEVLDSLIPQPRLAERQAALAAPQVRREGKHAGAAAAPVPGRHARPAPRSDAIRRLAFGMRKLRAERPGAGGVAASRAAAAGAGSAQAQLRAIRRHFAVRAADLQAGARRASEARGQQLFDPREFLGLKCKAKPAVLRPAIEEMLQGRWMPGFRNDLLPERELVLACLRAAVERARAANPAAALPSARALEDRYQRSFSRLLTQRPNPVIQTSLVLPVPGESVLALGRSLHRQLVAHCEQRPAIAVTEALQAAYEADQVKGAHCHQRTQHKHCANLYLSRFRPADQAQPLLTLTRHGVLSPMGLSRRGIAVDAQGRSQVSDEELGRAALDLAHDAGVEDAMLGNLSYLLRRGYVPEAQAWAEAARHVRADAGVGIPRGWMRRLPSFLCGTRPPPLIDRLRAAGALRRAREAAEVAMASLPDEVLAGIARDATAGRTPAVRLASISLLTPDPFRSELSSDELAMWRDQRRAWAALAEAPCEVPLPRLDARGRVMRDDEGRLLTTAEDGQPLQGRVKFEVLAMNVPVNEWGTSGLPLGSFATTMGANRQGMERLMGSHLLQWPTWRIRPGNIGGWVGEALRALDPAAAMTPAEAQAITRRRQALIELAMEVTRIYMLNEHHTDGADPYKLAKRLIVLSSLLPGTATLANCKSGKDRTSEAEAQARHLALEIALRQGHPPGAGEPMTPLRQAQLGVLHEAGGSREIQWWNTNMAGTKLGGQSLMRMYGRADKSVLTPRRVYNFFHGKDEGLASYVGNAKLTSS